MIKVPCYNQRPHILKRHNKMAANIPTSQTAALIENPGPAARLVIRDDIPVATPGSNKILVKLNCTGLWWLNYSSIPDCLANIP